MNLSRIFRLLCLLIGFTVQYEPCRAQSDDPVILAFDQTDHQDWLLTSFDNIGLYWHYYLEQTSFWTLDQGGYAHSANSDCYRPTAASTNFSATVWSVTGQGTNYSWVEPDPDNHGVKATSFSSFPNVYPPPAPSPWRFANMTYGTTNMSFYYSNPYMPTVRTNVSVYNYSTTTTIKLITGGSDTNINGLFELRFSGYKPAPGGWTVPITNFTGITICGTNLDSAGKIFLQFPDGTTNYVTPIFPPEITNCTFNVTPKKVRPQIIMANVPTNPTNSNPSNPSNPSYPSNPYYPPPSSSSANIADGAPITVVVGQRISLSCPTNTVAGACSNISWHLPSQPDIVVKDFYQSQTNGGPIQFLLIEFLQPSVEFYFVDGGLQQVICEAEVNGVTISSLAQFNVKRPTVTFSATTPGEIGIDANYYPDGQPAPAPYLHFGRNFSTNDVGIIFSFSGLDLQGYQGEMFVTQIGVALRKYNLVNGAAEQVDSEGLDLQFKYQDFHAVTNGASGAAWDSPGFLPGGYMTKVYRGNSAMKMHLMFQPTGVGVFTIPVPLRMVEWYWSGVATNTSSVLISSNHPPASIPSINITVPPSWTNHMRIERTNSIPLF